MPVLRKTGASTGPVSLLLFTPGMLDKNTKCPMIRKLNALVIC